MVASPSLLAADHRAGIVYEVDGRSRRVVAENAWLAEHAGFLRLPSPTAPGDWAFADDRGGSLVVGGGTGIRRIPVAIPAEHLAASPDGRHIVVTSGLGANEQPWSDVTTVVDLVQATSARFRGRTGEPGVVIVPDGATQEPMIVLRHREPGAIEALPLAAALAVGAHVPILRGEICDDIADDGHGDVVDQAAGIVGVATSRGLERFVVEHGRPRAIGVVPWPAPGRAYFVRRAGDDGRVCAVLRGGPSDPARWPEWTNTFAEIDLCTGETSAVPLRPGLVFRFALGAGIAALAVIHPGGDSLTRVDRHSARIVSETPLPALGSPPRPGAMPWDAVDGRPAQRRAVAVDPRDGTVAVTSGGDGTIHLLGPARPSGAPSLDTIEMPTPFDEGGHLLWNGGPAWFADPVGR